MEINQTTYETWKRKHSGTYQKFNTQVTKWYLSKMFDYEHLLETAPNFDTFTDFYKFHTEQKQELIKEIVTKMYQEASFKCQLQISESDAFEMLVVRLGNAYNGIYTENRILNTFMTLSPYIKCEKTDKLFDTNYKVDGIVELIGIDKLGIQIKPISFLKYDKGSELQHHERFKLEFGIKVHYVLYKDKNTIVFNNVEIKLSNKGKIVEQIEKLLLED